MLKHRRNVIMRSIRLVVEKQKSVKREEKTRKKKDNHSQGEHPPLPPFHILSKSKPYKFPKFLLCAIVGFVIVMIIMIVMSISKTLATSENNTKQQQQPFFLPNNDINN